MEITSAPAILARQINGIGPQHPTHIVAAALEFTTGQKWASLCCWCVDKRENMERKSYRVRAGYGECQGCSYSGRDCLVVEPV